MRIYRSQEGLLESRVRSGHSDFFFGTWKSAYRADSVRGVMRIYMNQEGQQREVVRGQQREVVRGRSSEEGRQRAIVGWRSSEEGGQQRRGRKEEQEEKPRLKSNNPTRTRWGIKKLYRNQEYPAGIQTSFLGHGNPPTGRRA